jgi:hypothetical protein
MIAGSSPKYPQTITQTSLGPSLMPAVDDPEIPFRVWRAGSTITKVTVSYRAENAAARSHVRRLIRELGIRGFTYIRYRIDEWDALEHTFYRLRKSELAKLMLALPVGILLDCGDPDRTLSAEEIGEFI